MVEDSTSTHPDHADATIGWRVLCDPLAVEHVHELGEVRKAAAFFRAILGKRRDDDVTARLDRAKNSTNVWVTLDDWAHGPIRCTDGQAAVFSALWTFKGTEVDGKRIMTRAGQASDKPIDLFKVKTANKGKPEYEGPLHAYRALVKSNRRQGVYWMPCAENSRN